MNETQINDANENGKSDIAPEEICTALQGCADLLDLLASAYFKPLTQEQIDRFAELDFAIFMNINEKMDQGAHDMQRYLAKRDSATRRDLAVDFTGAFAGTSTWEGRFAVPYESVFTSKESLLFQDAYHQVYRLYRANGVKRSEDYDYPDDHLSFMFEFLAIQCTKARDALEVSDNATAVACVDLALNFLNQHVLSWYGDFRSLAEKLIKTRFYRGLLTFTEGFLEFMRQLLEDTANELK